MQRATITLIVLLIFNNCFSQTFKNYEIKRLKTFEINTESIELNNSVNYLDLKAILEKEQKRKTNKTLAIVLTSLSALTMTYGAKIITSSKDDQEGLGGSIGIMIMTAGVVELGVSIPLFISSNKRKKERDNLIELYKKYN
jgi:hypothetical protein